MEKQNEINWERYVIDVRRVHQEVSSGENTACKYCGLYDSTYHCGFVADLLTTEKFQEISNSGFFRSGKYFWKQNQSLSCCKEYTIRMRVAEFIPSSRQARIFSNFYQYMSGEHLLSIRLDKPHKIKDTVPDPIQIEIQDILRRGIKKIDPAITLQQEKSLRVFKTREKKAHFYYSNFIWVLFLAKKQEFCSIDSYLVQQKLSIINYLSDEFPSFSYSIDNEYRLLVKQIQLSVSEGEEQSNKVKKEEPKQEQIKDNETCYKDSKLQTKDDSHIIQQSTKEANNENCLKANNKTDVNSQNIPIAGLVNQPKADTGKQQKQKKNRGKTKQWNGFQFDEFSSKCIKIGKLRIEIELSEYSQDIYELNNTYMQVIHNREGVNPQRFVEEKCTQIVVPYKLVSNVDKSQILSIGSHFFKYFLGQKLIGVSHVDILPRMFLSEYFFYQPELKRELHFGVCSALIEIEYVRRMQKFFPEFQYFNFVQYIPNTPKMNYKADFQPQEILCPVTNAWIPLTLKMKKKLALSPPSDPRLADLSVSIDSDINFSDMDIEQYLYSNEFLLYINGNYIPISQLIPEVQPQIIINLACIFQAMGKKLFNSLTFGYTQHNQLSNQSQN